MYKSLDGIHFDNILKAPPHSPRQLCYSQLSTHDIQQPIGKNSALPPKFPEKIKSILEKYKSKDATPTRLSTVSASLVGSSMQNQQSSAHDTNDQHAGPSSRAAGVKCPLQQLQPLEIRSPVLKATKKKPARSQVWTYFVQSNGGGQCKLCFKDVKGLNTTNLNNHLLRNHRIDCAAETTRQQTPTDCYGVENDDESADDPNVSPAKRAKVCAFEKTQPLQSRGLVHQPRIDKTISTISSFKDGGNRANEMTNALVFMIVKDDLPLSTTEKPGFQHLMKVACLLFVAPGRKAITAAIEQRYDILSYLIKQKLNDIPNFTITTDIWTDTMNTKSFLGCTCHFLEQDKDRLTALNLGVLELDKRHQSDYIGQKLPSLCLNWNIPFKKITVVVTDDASNMKKAVANTFGAEKHIPCFAHMLNLVLTKILDLENLKQLITKVKTIVTFFKHSTPPADELRKFQENNSPLVLIQDVCTRWNSTFYMLERFLVLSDVVNSVLLKIPKSPPLLNAEEVATILEITEILRPAEIATKELSGQGYITVSNVMPMISCLKQSIAAVKVESKLAEMVQNNLLKEIGVRFQGMEKNNLIAVATLLDPRFKRLHFPNAISVAKAIETVNQLLKSDEQNAKKAVAQVVIEQPEKSNIWKFDAELASKKENWDTEMSELGGLNSDLKQYLGRPLTTLNSNSIKYWK